MRFNTYRSIFVTSIVAASLGASAGYAAVAGDGGCPQFHCAPEATGIMYQPIVTSPTSFSNKWNLGRLSAQGCSGDGRLLGCISFANQGIGTLQILDAATLQVKWTDKIVSGSYVLQDGVSSGQVPFFFSSGLIGAGDKYGYALYGADGVVQKYSDGTAKVISLKSENGSNMGLTVIGPNLAVITQTSGFLTLIDTDQWTVLSTLKLLGGLATVISTPSGSSGVLYVPEHVSATDKLHLFAVSVDGSNQLYQRADFVNPGSTGASPVVVKPSVSGLASNQNLILLHVSEPSIQLLGLVDSGGSSFTTNPNWASSIALQENLQASPTIDEVTKKLYFQYTNSSGDHSVYAYSVQTGQLIQQYDIQALSQSLPVSQRLAQSFMLNSHVGAIQTGLGQSGGSFTLLLAGSSTNSNYPALSGQYVIGFQPENSVLWVLRTDTVAGNYTAAWNLSPSNTPVIPPNPPVSYCPVVVVSGGSNGDHLTRVCN